ncbi:hypothetical protein A8O14_07865 [Polynucleobacter wuianus]|uniref:Uncharacterized protein n=1 Tax=Polynucleobacter wuianus TaxID=1743168 RepID=A0A191UGA4_9BURK|nr:MULTISPECIES: hypothetical protein [Polynucleobacter]ANI99992.1 hypothetical protein A8O14_07865 [Polynucleobacter wuianus]MBU3552826.1 hypothetical protein [Polynucleobacter sp. MWH-Post4-6-1]
MTQVANEVEGFKSEVLTKGGSIQRVQDREAKKERERLEKEAYEKHAAESAARRNKAREERALELIAQAKARQEAAQLDKERSAQAQQTQKAERKSQSRTQATNLLDDLSKAPNASLTKLSEDIDEGEVLEEESEALEPESIFTPVKGEVHVPAFMPATEVTAPLQAHDLGEILPAPVAITVDTLPKTDIQAETAEELMKWALNSGSAVSIPDAEPSVNTESSGGIKSKRGCERVQRIINEKRDLEKQVEDLECTVTSLQDAIRKYEIESKLVGNVMTIADSQKKPSELVSEAKLQMLKFLNTRSDEIDHIDKAICFNKYMSDPFYMQVFVQNNQPEQWQTMIESIYEAIERPTASVANMRHSVLQNVQPIRARTATLGAPVASSEQPMDRIAQHLGNMGI